MLLGVAVETYVTDRLERGEIGVGSARQLRWRLSGIARLYPGLQVDQLGRDHVLGWQRATGWERPASRRAYLSTLKVFLAWCRDERLISGDPCGRLARVREPRRLPRALSDAQLKRLTMVLPDRRAVAVVALMARLGLRCCEVSAANVTDWDRPAATLLVTGKFANERRVAVPPDVELALSRHVGRRQGGPLIGGNPRRVGLDVVTWMTRAGLKTGPYDGMSAHALRHTAASNLLDAGANVRVVQDLLGHANLATTDRYLRRASLDAQRRALELGA